MFFNSKNELGVFRCYSNTGGKQFSLSNSFSEGSEKRIIQSRLIRKSMEVMEKKRTNHGPFAMKVCVYFKV